MRIGTWGCMALATGLCLGGMGTAHAGSMQERWTAPPRPVAVESVLVNRVDGRITIDAQGVPIDYRIETELTDKVRALLDKAVRGWRFEPVLVDGKPVTAEARMRVTLAAHEQGDGLRVGVDNVIFPTDADSANLSEVKVAKVRVMPPKYPGYAASLGVEGRVLLHLKISPEGRVEDMVAVQSSLANVAGKDELLGKLIAEFEEASLKAARNWRFRVDATGSSAEAEEGITFAIPVDYRMWDKKDQERGAWATEVRGPKRVAPWHGDKQHFQQVGVSDVSGNEMVYLGGGLRLATEVQGTFL